MQKFKEKLSEIVNKIKFWKINNTFQKLLKKDIGDIKKSKKI